MNSRIANTFETLAKQKKSAFISFITAGDPDVETSKKILNSLPDKGVDIIELGIPFSDPMADGVIIQESSERALTKGMTPVKIFEMVEEFRKQNSSTPIILMGYFNTILAMGLDNFAKTAKRSGVDGILVVDLPPEEADELKKELDKNDINLIFLITPTTNEKRLKIILQKASGFIYYVAVTGVTGTKSAKDSEVIDSIKIIKSKTNLPIVSGFGIKTPLMAKNISKIADGVVVGSAIVKKFADGFKKGKQKKEVMNNVFSFITELANSVKNINISN